MKSLIFSLVIFATPLTDVMPDMTGITKALKTGNAEALSKYFGEDVELALIDDEDIYEKEEARDKLAKFFSSNPPKSFNQVHKGTSKGEDSHYVIGDLVANGDTFRVYIYLEETEDSYVIQELRIEE